MSKRLLAFLQALLVVLLWSASPPLSKIAYAELAPVQLTALRFWGAAIVLLPMMWVHSRTVVRRLGRRDWLQLILMGILGFSLGNTILYIGLETLPSTTTSFLLNGIPIATILLGLLILGEKPDWMQWGGLFVTVIGGLVFFGWRIEFDQAYAVGLSLVGVLAISLHGILARGMTRSERIDPYTLTAIPMGVGSLILMVFAWPFPRLSWPVLAILAWLMLINSAIAFVLWNHALKHMQAFEISITSNLMPIGTALLAPLLLQEPMTGTGWLGMFISLAGVVLVGFGGRSPGLKSRMV